MQFKYPEILWGLSLLVIPIIIHLFQLRRFKKTPFTNVKFLKQVVSESRKSSTLKKWLLLFTRMALLTALIIAFAQPFIAKETALQPKETVFYLDDSFSMGFNNNGNPNFSNLIQEFIQKIPKDQKFSLFTNTKSFQNIEIADIQNKLLNIELSSKQLDLPKINLKAKTLFSKDGAIEKNLIIISDFQKRLSPIFIDTTTQIKTHYINSSNNEFTNAAIDTVYIESSINENIELIAELSNSAPLESLPVSLYNGNQLIAKTSAKFNNTKLAKVKFSINATEPILGKISITDNGLNYDNQFYFNIDEKSKIKVLSIGNESDEFLKRIYSNDEFDFNSTKFEQLNYSSIENQDLVILNELRSIPNALVNAINTFLKNGGSLILIPAMDIDLPSYNQLVSKYYNTNYIRTNTQTVPISNINEQNPIFKNVFEQNVTNFQYPTVNQYYTVKSSANSAIDLQNGSPFLLGTNQVFIFTAALDQTSSNFKNSPLIVPTFYNIGLNSLKLPPLYANIGSVTKIEIPITLKQDEIIKLNKEDEEFIPQQNVLPKKVVLSFTENPNEDGIYRIFNDNNVLGNLSFNYNRKESELVYLQIPEENKDLSLTNFFQEYQKRNTINEFWKWFAILALLFVLIETILQKFIK